MKICPNCNKEFDESNTVCPTCEQQLPAVSHDTGSIVETGSQLGFTAAPQIEEPENLNLLSFSGRIGRKAFNIRWIPLTIVIFYLSYLVFVSPNAASVISLYMIQVPLAICALTFTVRRLRDIGFSKWKIIFVALLTLLPQNNVFTAVLNLLISGYLIFKKGRSVAVS